MSNGSFHRRAALLNGVRGAAAALVAGGMQPLAEPKGASALIVEMNEIRRSSTMLAQMTAQDEDGFSYPEPPIAGLVKPLQSSGRTGIHEPFARLAQGKFAGIYDEPLNALCDDFLGALEQLDKRRISRRAVARICEMETSAIAAALEDSGYTQDIVPHLKRIPSLLELFGPHTSFEKIAEILNERMAEAALATVDYGESTIGTKTFQTAVRVAHGYLPRSHARFAELEVTLKSLKEAPVLDEPLSAVESECEETESESAEAEGIVRGQIACVLAEQLGQDVPTFTVTSFEPISVSDVNGALRRIAANKDRATPAMDLIIGRDYQLRQNGLNSVTIFATCPVLAEDLAGLDNRLNVVVAERTPWPEFHKNSQPVPG